MSWYGCESWAGRPGRLWKYIATAIAESTASVTIAIPPLVRSTAGTPRRSCGGGGRRVLLDTDVQRRGALELLLVAIGRTQQRQADGNGKRQWDGHQPGIAEREPGRFVLQDIDL